MQNKTRNFRITFKKSLANGLINALSIAESAVAFWEDSRLIGPVYLHYRKPFSEDSANDPEIDKNRLRNDGFLPRLLHEQIAKVSPRNSQFSVRSFQSCLINNVYIQCI